MQKYTLDELIVTFQEHAIKNDAQIIENREKYPDSEWAKSDFNISRALYNLCLEILILKKRKK